MGKIVAGIAGIGDVLGIGTAAAAEAGAGVAAADLAPGAFAAADAADLAAAGGAETLTSAAVPDLAAGGLDVANTTFGTFNPALFEANTADVAAGGFGTDLTAPSIFDTATAGTLAPEATIAGTPATGVAGISGTGADFFGGASGGTFTGAGFGSGSDLAGGFNVPFGDQMAGGGGFPQEPGSFAPDESSVAGGGTPDPGVQQGGEQAGFQERFGASQDFSTQPIVQQEGTSGGIVNTNQISSRGFDSFPSAGAEAPSFESTFPGATNPATGLIAPQEQLAAERTLTGVPEQFGDPAASPVTAGTSQLTTMSAIPPTTGGAIPPASSAPGTVLSTSEAFGPPPTPGAPTPAATATAGGPAAAPGGAGPGGGALAPGAGPPAGGGISPLGALRGATLGANALTAGINLSRALSGPPAYPALLPHAYPGGPFAPSFAPGGGGLGGGLAASRLTNALVAGQSLQQLAATGLIGPQRAAELQADYNGIAAAYARQLRVSPQALSTAVKRAVAARALGEMNLGGR